LGWGKRTRKNANQNYGGHVDKCNIRKGPKSFQREGRGSENQGKLGLEVEGEGGTRKGGIQLL